MFSDMPGDATQGEGLESILDPSGRLLATIVRARFSKPGATFVTSPELSQQIGCLLHPAGKMIEPHTHKMVPREVHLTQEVLIIRRGRLRVDFYGEDHRYLFSSTLEQGDTILLIRGGHGFETLEETDILEVKQGPYAGDADKTRLRASAPQQVIWYTP